MTGQGPARDSGGPDAGGAASGPVTAEAARERPARSRGGWVSVATWAYGVAILALLAAIRWVGDVWWVTALLFVPRWLLLAPIAALAAASALARRPSDWLLQGAVALVIAGPVMGFSIPWPLILGTRAEGTHFRVLCYNVGADGIDDEALIRMIGRERIDLVCLQEGARKNPALNAFLARGWYRSRDRYLASRYPIVAELPPLADDSTTEERISARLTRVRVRAPSGDEFVLASVHMPTLRPGLNRLMGGKVAGMKLHLDWWVGELDRVLAGFAELEGMPFLVGGDFNMPPDDSTMAALRPSLRFGFEEAGWGFGYTRPSKYPWFRIDHILASPEWSFTECRVGPDFGSDHLPLLAEVVLPRQPRRAARAGD